MICAPRAFSQAIFLLAIQALWTLVLCLPLIAQNHELPDLSDSQFLRNTAGIRPYREGHIRLEGERLPSGLPVFHNYGHGGGGISLAWGSAKYAVDLFLKTEDSKRIKESGENVAILGSGIIGLTTAYLLLKEGFNVRIYSSARTPKTTSDVAGGLWMPVSVATGETPEQRMLFERISVESYRMYLEIEGFSDLVRLLPMYVPRSQDGAEDYVEYTQRAFQALIREGLVSSPREWSELPISRLNLSGIEMTTLMIDTPRYMSRLHQIITEWGAIFETKDFASLDDVELIAEGAVFNAMGMGSSRVFGDDKMLPIRGQLVLMKPDPRIQYMLIHPKAYLFPRGDDIVIGGTFEKGVSLAVADPVDCDEILRNARELFSGDLRLRLPHE